MGKTLSEKAPRPTETPSDGGSSSHGWKTVLLNDDWHSFHDVAAQLVKAIRCTYDKGLAYANVVHHTGSAIVYQGPKDRCDAVALVLEEVRLKTQVTQ